MILLRSAGALGLAVLLGLLTLLLGGFAVLEGVATLVNYVTGDSSLELLPLPGIAAALGAVFAWRGCRWCWAVYWDPDDL